MNTLQPVIKTEHLSVVYNKKTTNEFWALQDINISIYPKEYIIFFGPSGCGKSTLLNSIAGLETNLEGKAFVDGKDISALNEDELSVFHRTRIGMVFQVYNLISSLSVLDNVTLPQVFMEVRKEERNKRAKTLLEKFGILEHANKIPTELSGGQQQRIGIARSLANNPKILLADEPVGNLDSVSSVKVMEILKDLNAKEGKTLILVTHNPEHLAYANRIFYIRDGKITREMVNREIRPEELAKGEATGKEEIKTDGAEEKINKELELLQRSFPGLTVAQLNMLLIPFKAKLLVNYLLSNYEIDEIARIENIIHDRLSGRTNNEELRYKLDGAFEKGGAGLNSITAARLGRIIEDVMKKTKIVIRGRRSAGGLSPGASAQIQPDFKSIWSQITQLRQSFIDPLNKNLTDRQIIRMESAIYNRLIGDFDKKSFNEMLDRSFEKGGVGLNKAAAKKITRDLEMIMLLSYGF